MDQSEKSPVRVGYRSNLNVREISGQLGKLPPQAVDLEEAVLGAMLLERPAITTIIDILHAETFYKDAHQEIYRAIILLFTSANPVDLLSVTAKLRELGKLEVVGGAYYITELTTRINSAANIEYHARIIQEQYIKRELIAMATETQTDAYEDQHDAFQIMERMEAKLFELGNNMAKREIIHLSEANDDLAKGVIDRQTMKREISGVPTGFTAIDRVTGGWQPTNFIVIAARPGMGKSAFVVTSALETAKTPNVTTGELDNGVLIFSLEMSSIEVAGRIMAQESNTPVDVIMKKKLDEYVLSNFTEKIDKAAKYPIYIDDSPDLTIMELRAKSRRLMASKPIKLIIVDYIQLMSAGKDRMSRNMNREQEIAKISRNLKSLGKELNVPVIGLAQLNRSVETRGGDKRPKLADLRESGAIEQDADVVTFLYRPKVYNITNDGDHYYSEGETEFIIAKHRNGALDTVNILFKEKYTRFTDMKEEELREITIQKTEEQKENDDLPF